MAIYNDKVGQLLVVISIRLITLNIPLGWGSVGDFEPIILNPYGPYGVWCGKKLGDYYFSLGMKVFSTGEYRKGLSDLSFFSDFNEEDQFPWGPFYNEKNHNCRNQYLFIYIIM